MREYKNVGGMCATCFHVAYAYMPMPIPMPYAMPIPMPMPMLCLCLCLCLCYTYALCMRSPGGDARRCQSGEAAGENHISGRDAEDRACMT